LPDNKLLLSINAASTELSPTKVARLNEDGSRDSSFGNNGIVEIPFKDEAFFVGNYLSLLPSGGWLITGTLEYVNGVIDLAVVRQLQDGQLDTSFGPAKDGKVTINIYDLIDSRTQTGASFITHRHDEKNGDTSSNGPGNVGTAAVAQQDGKMVLVSTVFFDFNYLRGIVLRLNMDGSLDKTFNQKGFVLVELPDITHNWNYATGVAVQQDGKVLACGNFSTEEWPDAYVIRYDQDGNIDKTYGDNKNGVVTITDSSRWLNLVSMALKADGGVVAVGGAEDLGYVEGLIASLMPSGSFNLVFNNGKPLFSTFKEDGVSWESCFVQADGNLVVSGEGGPPARDENGSLVTARYAADGTLDVKFAGQGWTAYNHEPGFDVFLGGTVMADNRVVISGYGIPTPPPLPGYVVRYLA
jgi:uncharacterized delta-60 repeat protein